MTKNFYGRIPSDFEPNVRVVLKRTSVFVQLPGPDITSPLFGKIESGTDDSSGYDERKYQNSIMRHSPLFERMREMRRSIEKSSSFYDGGENYSDTHPSLPEQTELYCDGRVEMTDDGKVLLTDNGEELIFGKDGTLRWRAQDPFCPEIVFENGKRISHAYFPHLDFLLKLGAEPEFVIRNCVTTGFSENLSERGGTMSLEYVIELGGIEFENTKLTLTLYPIGYRI